MRAAVREQVPSASLQLFRQVVPPQVRTEEPAEFGHCPYLDRPRLVADHIASFVDELR